MSIAENLDRGTALCSKCTVALRSGLGTLAILRQDTGGFLEKTTVMTSLLLGGCSYTGWTKARLREWDHPLVELTSEFEMVRSELSETLRDEARSMWAL